MILLGNGGSSTGVVGRGGKIMSNYIVGPSSSCNNKNNGNAPAVDDKRGFGLCQVYHSLDLLAIASYSALRLSSSCIILTVAFALRSARSFTASTLALFLTLSTFSGGLFKGNIGPSTSSSSSSRETICDGFSTSVATLRAEGMSKGTWFNGATKIVGEVKTSKARGLTMASTMLVGGTTSLTYDRELEGLPFAFLSIFRTLSV
uniref:Uncharacterized protein n=1 Tax=Cannabis sativa TaxID=3483 RepID=A0A803PDN0_CANSA